jgi:archaellum component FlaC
VKAEFRQQIGIQSEHFQHKLDVVGEGHGILRKEIRDTREELYEKIKSVDFKVDVLNQKIDDVRDDLSQKIDGVADDLKAHRADTEVHKKVEKVKED